MPTAVAPSSHNDLVSVFGRQVAYKWVVAAVYVSALFLDILDTTIVNVAIPTLGRELNTDNAEWVVLGYTLSLAVWIPTSGWLGDRFGTKRTFLFALAAFTVGSGLCGVAQTIDQLIAFRVLQGVGGGMLTPVGIAMLFRAFPPAERAKASTVVMVPTLIAPALGPVLGGFITTNFDWRWIFLVNVPIALVALWFGHRHLREHREPSARGFDIPGFVLSGASLALIVYALSEGPRAGWTSNVVVLTGLGGVVCGVLTVIVELHVANPMLELRLLRNRMFRLCNTVGFFSIASFLGVTFVMPLYLQLIRGMDPLQSGLTTFPQAIGVMASSFIAGSLYGRIGPRRLMAGGFFSAGLAISLYTGLTVDTNLWLIRGLMLLRGGCVVRRGHHGQRAGRSHVAEPAGVARGFGERADRCAPGVRDRRRVRHAGSVLRVVHPRRRRQGDDGGAFALRVRNLRRARDRTDALRRRRSGRRRHPPARRTGRTCAR